MLKHEVPAELTALQTPLHFKQEDDKVLTQAKHAGKGKVLIPAESHSNILLRVPSSGECFLRLYQTALNLGLYLSSDPSAQLQARFCVQSLFTEGHHPNFRSSSQWDRKICSGKWPWSFRIFKISQIMNMTWPSLFRDFSSFSKSSCVWFMRACDRDNIFFAI